MTERLNFSRIYSAAFLTHQEDRNVLTDKKFIAKIQVCLPTNYRLSHHHTVRKKIFFVFLLRKEGKRNQNRAEMKTTTK